jgi:hypothetical protein
MFNKKIAFIGAALVLVVTFSFMSNQKALQGRLSSDIGSELAADKETQSKQINQADRASCIEAQKAITAGNFEMFDESANEMIDKCSTDFFMDFYRPETLERCGDILFDYKPTNMVESCVTMQANLEEACRNIRIFYIQPGKEVSENDPLAGMGSVCANSFPIVWSNPIGEAFCQGLESDPERETNAHKRLQKQLCESR